MRQRKRPGLVLPEPRRPCSGLSLYPRATENNEGFKQGIRTAITPSAVTE